MLAISNSDLQCFVQSYESLLALSESALTRSDLHAAAAFLHSAVDLAGTHLWGLIEDRRADQLLETIATTAFGPRRIQTAFSDKPIRIAFLMQRIHETRGGGKTFFPLADQLRQHGYETAFYVLESRQDADIEIRFRDAGIPLLTVPAAQTMLGRARNLRQLLQAEQIDAVFNFDMGDWLVGLLATAGGDVPVTIYTHFSDHLFSLGAHSLDCHLGLRPPALDPCHSTKETARCHWLPVPGSDLVLEGTNNPPTRESLGIPRDAFVSITVTNLNKLANGTLYFEALDTVLQAHPNLHHLLVGGGSPVWMDFTRQQSARMRAGNRMHLLGPRTDVPHLLRVADVFVDSHPIGAYGSVIEAMQTGLPVIELLQDRPAIFSVADAVADARCIATTAVEFTALFDRLLVDRAFRLSLGGDLKARYNLEFSRTAVIARYATFIRELFADVAARPTLASSNKGRRYTKPLTLGNPEERKPDDYLLDGFGIACRQAHPSSRLATARAVLQTAPRLIRQKRLWAGFFEH